MPERDFRRVLAAEGVSNFGAMLSRLAIPWLATLSLQAAPLQMAGLLVADVIAAAAGALLLGGWIDRRGKRAVMLLCDGARCALLAALAVASWQDWVTMTMLAGAAATSGVLTMGFELARSAWTAQHYAACDLPRRNAQLSMTASLSETAAFALGGLLCQGLGAALSLAADALSYAFSALCLRGVREAPAAPMARQAAAPDGRLSAAAWRLRMHDLAGGLRAVSAVPVLRVLAGIEVLLALGLAMAGTSTMIFVARDLGLPTGELGIIFALGGLGSVLGAGLAPSLGRRLGPGRTMAWGLTALAQGAACVPLAGTAGAAGGMAAGEAVPGAGRCNILGLDPGQDQKPCVVEDELQILQPRRLLVADEALAPGELTGAHAEPEPQKFSAPDHRPARVALDAAVLRAGQLGFDHFGRTRFIEHASGSPIWSDGVME